MIIGIIGVEKKLWNFGNRLCLIEIWIIGIYLVVFGNSIVDKYYILLLEFLGLLKSNEFLV